MRKPTSLKITCMAFIFCATTIAASAQTFTTLANFGDYSFNYPAPGMLQGFNGDFYGGTTPGIDGTPAALFEVATSATLTSPFAFLPFTELGAPLVQASNGNFYGILYGLDDLRLWRDTPGTFFELTPSGTYTALYNFCSQANCSDGTNPIGFMLGADGNFYGTTGGGGANGLGTFFEISPAGNLATLHSFAASEAYGGVLQLQAADGSFYGTSVRSGTHDLGTVFKITLPGQVSTLYSFCSRGNCLDGSSPNSLVLASDGNLYGTTLEGGSSEQICYLGGCGTIFRITPEGKFKTLHNFNLNDSAAPNSLLQATDGNLYGSTAGDAGYSFNSLGTVFEFQPRSGILTTLHSFTGADGYGPQELIEATNGSFYGTTSGVGTVFSVSTGLAPFVETIPTSAKVGARVVILGYGLTGATAVSFNLKSARFTVVSDTEITAEVPAGATSGTVKVGTSSGTLSSSVVFRVSP